jgi:Lrp/AsnC family leucine-responsive transcriptional regulator
MTLDPEARIDRVDWQLLIELQQNARLSYTELGRRVGLTAPAVAERIRRMEEAGIVEGYRVELNMGKLGRPLRALIRLAAGSAKSPDLLREIIRFPEVLECHLVTGEDRYILKVAVDSAQHLDRFIERMGAYGKTVTYIILSSPLTNRVVTPADETGEAGNPSALRELP